MSELIDEYIQLAKKNNPGEPEFHQTIEEVLTSIEPVLAKHSEYIKAKLIERLIEPERMVTFRVVWTDDNGQVQVNRGYRCQFNSALGPYKGGIRFAPQVTAGTMKFLAFEQIFKNSLTGLPIGGGKGGSDFNPIGKSDNEIMRFCQSFMTELYRHIGPDIDSPAGDLGVSGKEVAYMFGQYKRLTGRFNESMSGKPPITGGLLGRTEATGYGIVFFAREVLKHEGETLKGKRCVVSGFGNVAWGTVKKLDELGAKVVGISGPDGYVIDEDGITGDKIDYMVEMRSHGEQVVKRYYEKYPTSKYVPGKKIWEEKADLYFPCALQNEIRIEDAKRLVENGCKYLIEGSNMPTTNDAIKYLQDNNVIIAPSKAANAGGVSCSCIEMGQNAGHAIFSPEDVYQKLETIMVNIYKQAEKACEKYNLGYDLIKGANIAGFERVAEAMMAQGYV